MALMVKNEIVNNATTLGINLLNNRKRLREEKHIKEYVEQSSFVDIMERIIDREAENRLDEYEGQIQDKKRQKKREDIISRRRANISEKARMKNGPCIRKDVISKENELLYDYFPASKNIEDADSDEFLEHSSNSDYWEEYIPIVKIKETGTHFEKLIGGGIEELCEYIKNNCKSIYEVRNLLVEVKNRQLLQYDYYVRGCIQILDIIINNSLK